MCNHGSIHSKPSFIEYNDIEEFMELWIYMALSLYVWTDRLLVNAQGQKQVIYINLLQYLLTPLLA